jgi:predicted short-subunit dehydrogenase-like oxidoreductase (DUF2520 family)
MQTLNLIGCGKVGQCLGALWNRTGVFSIKGVCNLNLDSAKSAVNFIGAGVAVSAISELKAAQVFAIAAPDDALSSIAKELSDTGIISPGTTVFHCSGALTSRALAPLRDLGAGVASAHPVKSFSNPGVAVESFSGTTVTIEGDQSAVALVSEAFTKIGGRVIDIDVEAKGFYHTALVFACNYLTALMECAVDTCGQAGIERAKALSLIEPLVKETVAAIFSRGTEQALTGPLARGDSQVVGSQIDLLKSWKGEYAELYTLLGQVALRIAERSSLEGEGDKLANLRGLIFK